jgi:hypothetical protein
VTPRSRRDRPPRWSGASAAESTWKTLRWAPRVRVHRAEILTVARHLDRWKKVTGDEVRAILAAHRDEASGEACPTILDRARPEIVAAPKVTPARNLTPCFDPYPPAIGATVAVRARAVRPEYGGRRAADRRD